MLPAAVSERGLPPEIIAHYNEANEADRLTQGVGQLEFARTQEILLRHLPPPPAVVFDVGGGAGIYACWLAEQGYKVYLLDPVAKHIEQARQASDAQPDHPLAGFALGDARDLPWRDSSAHVVLMLGPLYHLTEPADRVHALREACRVLRPGGLLFAAAISRFASLCDGLSRSLIDDDTFFAGVRQDLIEGQHRNPTGNPDYFTTAYLHLPDRLLAEVHAAGLQAEALLGLEGMAWMMQDFEARWADPARRERLLEAIRLVEAAPAVLGASAHLLTVARKP